nr:kinase [Cafeteriavirus-dependent mavirus]CAI9421381.1 kinase [Cafeteriavirus-dependent mavirus]
MRVYSDIPQHLKDFIEFLKNNKIKDFSLYAFMGYLTLFRKLEKPKQCQSEDINKLIKDYKRFKSYIKSSILQTNDYNSSESSESDSDSIESETIF